MGMVGSLTLNGYLTGGLAGPRTINPAGIAFAAANEDVRTTALANGDNTITPTAGTTMVVIAIPITSQTLKWGPGAGTNHTMCANPAAPLFVAMPWTSGTITINSTGAVTVEVAFL